MSEDWVTLEVGEKAPNFDALLTDGSQISLKGILSEGKRVILYYYPKDNTPGCTTQACDFRDNYSALNDAGYRVFGVSKDSAKSHQNFTNKYELNFDLIVDQDIELHQKYGVWREKNNYGKTYMGVSRSTFVIDTDGSLIWVGYNIRAKGHVEKLMRELNIE
ncbi:MAG TPA: thioredoxin-dependent thiol peroxidase [Candidatus Thalassarchaeaceae archaeon]|jgi:peroxiredoxin Q/BCP|nr:thioredoxin-dependent thiol peroxidase [Candidatus Thalassarchaeaceae archaeon]HJL64483.1 thioredoxin-dependent thiol peroxidase [Candidatus Thalassarchaeaceae archaeon]HJO41926.1 thioredoxin-dependent thiol peroxidase [Candidatus Thalassarchaeaceae archaeon]